MFSEDGPQVSLFPETDKEASGEPETKVSLFPETGREASVEPENKVSLFPETSVDKSATANTEELVGGEDSAPSYVSELPLPQMHMTPDDDVSLFSVQYPGPTTAGSTYSDPNSLSSLPRFKSTSETSQSVERVKEMRKRMKHAYS